MWFKKERDYLVLKVWWLGSSRSPVISGEGLHAVLSHGGSQKESGHMKKVNHEELPWIIKSCSYTNQSSPVKKPLISLNDLINSSF
jgi:hypothetical protein